ncbi:dihydrolipoyl dehydrogenase [Aurantimonas coralicida]|jgi:dihydrolipoamide dehydrogenase|uniref:dihydrolipoyl dehydrogenase n=1 Tax=Aurantimonas coralicida TaxID=182270 RepID=UPI001D188148|nr:dihydrolipoyl dehydrogenase [Aurantimonas coralicida]MCC4300088.1 dihydrolipoyl dehydrogenase [Aurantimonas coralicida]
MSKTYDVVIIGGGPGGYQAAIRAGQLGMTVACIEERERLGGTCLNVGCIPSKALLESSERYAEAKNGLATHGIEITGLSVNLPQMMAHKGKVVSDLGKGIEYLFRKNKVEHVRGTGTIVAPDSVSVNLADGAVVRLKTKAIVIATGSAVVQLPDVDIDEGRIVSSTGALSLPEIPKKLAVIGAGVIGLELGSVWARLGAEVTVFEFLDRIAPGIDAELAKQMQRILEKQGLTFRLDMRVTGSRTQAEDVVLTVEPARGGQAEETVADVVLVAIGRRPYTEGLGLETVGVELDERGRVTVDPEFRTSVPGIYAIGDVIAGPMLAHKASEKGVVLMERLAGMRPHLNYETIPNIIYTWPELATVGRTEEELQAAGVEYKTGRFPFSANSRARAQAETDGLVKILADARTDRVLGVHMIGPDAGTMIHEAAVAMEFGAAAEDIARTTHAHPTLPEALKEAALAVEGRALHV